MRERVENFKSNPAVISPKTLEELYELLTTNKNKTDFDTWKTEPWSFILHPVFQMYRICQWSWHLSNPEEIIQKDDTSLKDVDSGSPDYFKAVAITRSWIGGAFAIEAQRNKLSPPEVNRKMINVHVIPGKSIDEARALKEGAFMLNQDSLLKQWALENPEFHQLMMKVVEAGVPRLTKLTLKPYQEKLSRRMLKLLKQRVEESWRNELTKTAVHTYVMFTPSPPTKIPVQVKELTA